MNLPRYEETKPPEYERMREAGRIAAATHEHVGSLVEAGQSTVELDREAEAFLRDRGARPAFRDYREFAHTLTVSINDELIHAPPRPARFLKEGDVVSLDLGAKVEGHYSDTAVTYIVGAARDPRHDDLLRQTQTALRAGIMQCVAGNTLEDVGRALEENSAPFGNVTDWAGHFIGRELHLDPKVYSRAHRNEHRILETGMCLAVEPILTLSKDASTEEVSPGGTVRSRTGEPAAHFEHTVWVHEDRAEVLTARSDEPRFL